MSYQYSPSAYSDCGRSEWCNELMRDLDGHAWDIGLVRTHPRKSRGQAINVKVVAEDDARQLAIVQVRQTVFHERRYSSTRKNTYLCGRNDNANAFAHPVPHGVARSKDPVSAAEAYIFDCTPAVARKIVRRQGDVAFVPVRPSEVPADLEPWAGPVAANDSNAAHHLLIEGALISPSHPTVLYARDATLRHMKDQHPVVSVNGGKLFRVVVGRRESEWNFSAATVD